MLDRRPVASKFSRQFCVGHCPKELVFLGRKETPTGIEGVDFEPEPPIFDRAYGPPHSFRNFRIRHFPKEGVFLGIPTPSASSLTLEVGKWLLCEECGTTRSKT